jgi:hypothetical protein
MKKLTKKQIEAIHRACEYVDRGINDYSCNALNKATKEMDMPDLTKEYEAFFDPPKIAGILWGVLEDHLTCEKKHSSHRILMLLLFAETKGQL